MKNLNDLAQAIAKREGQKVSLSIAQVKEVLAIVSDYVWCDSDVIELLIKAGRRRAKG